MRPSDLPEWDNHRMIVKKLLLKIAQATQFVKPATIINGSLKRA